MAQPPNLSKPSRASIEVAEEGVAAQLAVGDHVEPGRLLEADRLVDRAVLDPLELGGGELAAPRSVGARP